MKSYQNTMGKVRQNTSGHSIIYNGTEVKELDLYGTFNGVVFVSRPFIARLLASLKKHITQEVFPFMTGMPISRVRKKSVL